MMPVEQCGITDKQWESGHTVQSHGSCSQVKSTPNCTIREVIPIGPFRLLVTLVAAVALLSVAKVASGASATAPRDVSGRVVDPSGRPVAGAQVALGTEGSLGMQCTGVIIDPPVLRPITGFEDTTSGIVETDAEGRFSFPAVSGDFMLIASHPTGFARVDVQDFTPSMTIRLERWSQIEGTLYVGRKPAADGVVHLDLPRFSYAREVRYRHEVRTDRAGRFVVRQVIPGWVLINYGIETQREDGATVTKSSVGHEIYVKPGETLKIKLGGTGRPVIGKLVLPADISRPAGATWGCAELHRMPPDPPKPAGYDQMTESERRQWYKQWAQTPEGQAYFKSRVEPDPNERSHLFHVDSRNLFRIEDVIPGRYQLLVPLWNLESEVPATQLVGLYFAVVEVPPIRKTYVDEPLNLGDVMLKDRPEQVPWNPPPEELVGPEISG